MLTGGLVVVDADALQLQVRVPHIVATGVYSMLIADDLPELQGKRGSAGAVTALAPKPVIAQERLWRGLRSVVCQESVINVMSTICTSTVARALRGV